MEEGKGRGDDECVCVQNPTPLMYATSKGKTSMVEKFLACGAKPEQTDEVQGRGMVV